MYDLDRIMTRAWETYREGDVDFTEALHSSWVAEKEMGNESVSAIENGAELMVSEEEPRQGNEQRRFSKMGNETIEQVPKNVVIAAFQNGNYSARTDPVWQYDYGLVLRITGVELPSAYEVHFSNDPLGFSKAQIGDESGVRIPDEYLLTGQMVYAWLFLHEGAEDGETKLSISIPVRRRAMPLDEEPTSGEQSVIAQTIAALNQAVSDVEAAAEEVKSLIQMILIVNATEKNIDGAYYLVLDKTYAEIRDASFTVIKYDQFNGSTVSWYVYSVNETPKTVHAVLIQSDLSISMLIFTAESDDDYPKIAI